MFPLVFKDGEVVFSAPKNNQMDLSQVIQEYIIVTKKFSGLPPMNIEKRPQLNIPFFSLST
jgi:hypothetical protein